MEQRKNYFCTFSSGTLFVCFIAQYNGQRITVMSSSISYCNEFFFSKLINIDNIQCKSLFNRVQYNLIHFMKIRGVTN